MRSLRTGLTIGAPQDIIAASTVLGAREICNVYGQTESYGNCCVTPHDWPLERRANCQGPPLPSVTVRIIDAIDHVEPGAPVITSPAAGSIWNRAANELKVTGTASDDRGVTGFAADCGKDALRDVHGSTVESRRRCGGGSVYPPITGHSQPERSQPSVGMSEHVHPLAAR